MKISATSIPGVHLIEAQPSTDERGSFARLYCPDEFAAAGIRFAPVQVNHSRNTHKHTLRGMHYQNAPHAEAKLVHVTSGSIYDVAVDLRPDSPAYRKWTAYTLSADDLNALFIPEGCAHGFLTLQDDSDVLYHMGRMFEPGHDQGFRWNDPAFAITWPADPKSISDRDADYPDFET